MYIERILEDSPSLDKPHMEFHKECFSGAKELQIAKSDIARFKNRRRAAKSVKAQVESELSDTCKTVKDISLLMEESRAKAKARLQDSQMLTNSSRSEEMELDGGSIENYQYAEVMKELEFVKQELSKLKLDMAAVVKEKSRAEKEIGNSSMKMWSYSSSAEALKKEIEKASEEQVLVELARMEALKECSSIQVYRDNEANQFSTQIEKIRMRTKEIIEEIDHSKELEMQLAVTMYDVDALQNELKLVKAMTKKMGRSDSIKNSEGSSHPEEPGASPLMLQSIMEELVAAKKELASVKDEGFKFMASMDIIRNELKHVMEETSRLEKTENKADLTIQNLNSKLLRARSKLEAVSSAEQKAKSFLSNLALTLELSKTEIATTMKENELIRKETEKLKAEIQNTESQIDLNEERLQATMQELEDVKKSEALALENLKTLVGNTIQVRASASQHSSSITISQFEYDYLTRSADGAEELADEKVSAAQAWIEALKSSEKEILMKTEICCREIREIQIEEENELKITQKLLSARREIEEHPQSWRTKREKGMDRTLSRKSMRDSSNLTPVRRGAKPWKPATPVARGTPRPSSFKMKRKRKAMPNLSKFFSGKKVENDI